MKMQIRAAIKKEFLYFAKTFRMYGVLLAMILLATLTPLMMYGTTALLEETMLTSVSEDANGDEYYENDIYGEEDFESRYLSESASALFSGGVLSYFCYVLNGITGTALLILMLVMMSAAGGEQKKKNMIIPNCSGLTAINYVVPKVIFYALFTFISTAAISIFGYFLCIELAEGQTLPIMDIVSYIGANSLFCTFIIVLYLFLGLSTGKAGMSVILIYIFLQIFPTIMEFADVNKYNPISLMKYSMVDMSIDGKELIISASITVALIIVLVILTTILMKAKRINNARKAD